MTVTRVATDDIATVRADALLVPLRRDMVWGGYMDRLIENCGGDQFHAQALRALIDSPNIKVVVAESVRAHTGAFGSVVFVIDSPNFATMDKFMEPLDVVIKRGLDACAEAGYRSASMPMFRMGAQSHRGGTIGEKITQIVAGIGAHCESPGALDVITVVTYRNYDLANRVHRSLLERIKT